METKPGRQLLKTDENINLVHFAPLNMDLVTRVMHQAAYRRQG